VSNRVVLASRNRKKVAELRRILATADLDVEVLGSEVFADLPEIPETGASFVENALIKAVAVAKHSGLPAIADDSGLCVDALNAMPGILSARWAGRNATDEDNLDLVLDQLHDIPAGRRGAQFRCAAAVAVPESDGSIRDQRAVEGELSGELRTGRSGDNGFGYDPIFQPTGYDITTAQMSSEQKDAISHRGQALRALATVLGPVLKSA
jgi:XTP/dITP diphosphohydrolase